MADDWEIIGDKPLRSGSDLADFEYLRFKRAGGGRVVKALQPLWTRPRDAAQKNQIRERGVWLSEVEGSPKQVQQLVSHLDQQVHNLTFIDLRPTAVEHYSLSNGHGDKAGYVTVKYPPLKVERAKLIEARDAGDWSMNLRVENAYMTRTVGDDDTIKLGPLPGYNPRRKDHDFDDDFTQLRKRLGSRFDPEVYEIRGWQLLSVLAGDRKGMVLRVRREAGRTVVGRLWVDDESIWKARNMQRVVVLGSGSKDNINAVTGRQRKPKSGTAWPKPTGPTSWRNTVHWYRAGYIGGQYGIYSPNPTDHEWQLCCMPGTKLLHDQ